jgi:hypothetical protein
MDCWYCGESSMRSKRDKSGHPYCQCYRCSATHVDVPFSGPTASVVEFDKIHGSSGSPNPMNIMFLKAAKQK